MQNYLNLLQDVIDNGEGHDDRTGVGTRSVFGRQWRHDMRTGFPLLTTKKVPLRWVFEELRWFLSGSSDVKDLQKAGVTIWDEWGTAEQCAKFGREANDLGPVYGPLWRNFDGCPMHIGVDQIAKLLDEIKNNPSSRRLIVTGWHAEDCGKVALPPCHTLWQIKVHVDSDEISLHLYARSIDIFLGLPFNITSYAMLLTMLGGVTGYMPRGLIISFGDLHLYNNHIDQATEQLSRSPRSLPKVTIEANYNREAVTYLEQLLGIEWTNIDVEGYNPHPAIKAEVAI